MGCPWQSRARPGSVFVQGRAWPGSVGRDQDSARKGVTGQRQTEAARSGGTGQGHKGSVSAVQGWAVLADGGAGKGQVFGT